MSHYASPHYASSHYASTHYFRAAEVATITPRGGDDAWYEKPYKRPKKLARKIEEWVDEEAKTLYGMVISSKTATKAIKKQAAVAVRPYAKPGARKLPQATKIDWIALQKDQQALQSILNLWDEIIALEAQKREQEALFLLMF